MSLCIEDLPTEIWLLIFSCLEAQDLFRAFSDLNDYFDRLLNSNYLRFHIQFRTNNIEYYRRHDIQLLSDSVLNRTTSFESLLTNRRHTWMYQFLRCNYDRFTRLQTLTLNVSREEVCFIPVMLEKLKLLRHLSLKCPLDQKLLETILTRSTLIVCELDFWSTISSFTYTCCQNSNIERLCLKLERNSCLPIARQILPHMPNLKSLETPIYHDQYTSLYDLIPDQPFIFQQLQTFKLKLNRIPLELNSCKNLIHMMPLLKRFCLQIPIRRIDKAYINSSIYPLLFRLIHNLWTVSDKIRQLAINIQYNPKRRTRDNDELAQFINRHQEISTKISAETNACFKIQNTETSLGIHKLQMTLSRRFIE